MKYYTRPTTNALMAFALDGSQDHLIDQSFVPVPPEAEAAALAAAANPVRPFAEAKAMELASFRADRGKMLDCLTGIAGRFSRAGDAGNATACDVLARGLLDLPAHAAVASAQDVPTLRAAMKARYNTLLAGVPAPVMAAYKGVLA